mmetsp:Transcript_24479/g.68073  ORF Transcript_24479/g.68073 Transcript_24479/m.68073 type:complete len:354 (+) Transcript_24479:231-1292(+)
MAVWSRPDPGGSSSTGRELAGLCCCCRPPTLHLETMCKFFSTAEEPLVHRLPTGRCVRFVAAFEAGREAAGILGSGQGGLIRGGACVSAAAILFSSQNQVGRCLAGLLLVWCSRQVRAHWHCQALPGALRSADLGAFMDSGRNLLPVWRWSSSSLTATSLSYRRYPATPCDAICLLRFSHLHLGADVGKVGANDRGRQRDHEDAGEHRHRAKHASVPPDGAHVSSLPSHLPLIALYRDSLGPHHLLRLSHLHLSVDISEVGANDRDRQRDDKDAREHHHHAKHAPVPPDGVHVSIANRGHRYQAPPHGGRDAFKRAHLENGNTVLFLRPVGYRQSVKLRGLVGIISIPVREVT